MLNSFRSVKARFDHNHARSGLQFSEQDPQPVSLAKWRTQTPKYQAAERARLQQLVRGVSAYSGLLAVQEALQADPSLVNRMLPGGEGLLSAAMEHFSLNYARLLDIMLNARPSPEAVQQQLQFVLSRQGAFGKQVSMLNGALQRMQQELQSKWEQGQRIRHVSALSNIRDSVIRIKQSLDMLSRFCELYAIKLGDPPSRALPTHR